MDNQARQISQVKTGSWALTEMEMDLTDPTEVVLARRDSLAGLVSLVRTGGQVKVSSRAR